MVRPFCASLLLVPSVAFADGSLGNYRQSALREDFTVSQWQDSCGVAPKSTQSGGGETVAARVEGDELVITGGGRVYRSSECYEIMPGLARDAHSRDPSGKSWRTRCSNPKNDPRRVVLQTQVTLSEGRIDIMETGKYEVTVSDGHCSADVKRTRSFVALAAPAPTETAPPPAPVVTAEEPKPATGLCANPGPSVRVEVKPARKVVQPGDSFRVRVSAYDAAGCTVTTDATWSASEALGVHVDSHGLVRVDASAKPGTTEVMVATQQKRAIVVVETVDKERYDALLKQGDFNAEGESVVGTSVVLDAHDEREVQAVDQARTRKLVFGGVVGGLTVLLGIVYALLSSNAKKREAKAREEVEARYREQLREAEAKQKQQQSVHDAQLAAHKRSVAAREEKRQARLAKAEASHVGRRGLVCPVCSQEFPPPYAHCPNDGATLVAESTKGPASGHGFCPICFRGFPEAMQKCPEHQEELVPAVARPPEKAPVNVNAQKGKICPSCGERFEGNVAFCGKDGTTLVLVM